MKKGDTVVITQGPIEKVGRVGTITTLLENGAMVKIGADQFTAVQFIHLEKLYQCLRCKDFKRDYELSPLSLSISKKETNLSEDICLDCEKKLQNKFKKQCFQSILEN